MFLSDSCLDFQRAHLAFLIWFRIPENYAHENSCFFGSVSREFSWHCVFVFVGFSLVQVPENSPYIFVLVLLSFLCGTLSCSLNPMLLLQCIQRQVDHADELSEAEGVATWGVGGGGAT